MKRRACAKTGILVDVPGQKPMVLKHLVLDFNGTLAAEGALLPGVKRRLVSLARSVEITILTADTFGTARAALRSLPAALRIVETGLEKKKFVLARRREGVVAIGNGNNDIEMIRHARLGIALLGPECMSSGLLVYATVVAATVQDALDLLLKPRRLVATLRW